MIFSFQILLIDSLTIWEKDFCEVFFSEKVIFMDYANFASFLTENHLLVTFNLKIFYDCKSDSLNEEFE